jgi:rod shape-determining protein MreD
MRTWVFVLLAYVAVLLEAAVAPRISISQTRPDFLVLLVVYGSLVMGARPATVAGFAAGLAVDAEAGQYLGLNALILAAIGFLSARVWSHLVRGNLFVQCGLLFAACLAHDLVYYFIWYGGNIDMLARFMVRHSVLGGAYTAALGAVVFAFATLTRVRAIIGGVHAS